MYSVVYNAHVFIKVKKSPIHFPKAECYGAWASGVTENSGAFLLKRRSHYAPPGPAWINSVGPFSCGVVPHGALLLLFGY